MANIRVKDLPNTNAANDNDEFIVDSSTSGTRRISYSELKSEISTDFAADVATYGIATLDSDNKLTAAQIPDSLAQGMNFVGVANSAGDLTSTTQGDFYVIQTAFGVYSVGDQAVYDGSAYVRVVDGTKEISEGGTGGTTLDAAKTNLEIIDIGSSPNQVSLNSMLGDLAFQSSDGVSMGDVEAESLEVTGTITTKNVGGATKGQVEFQDDSYTISGGSNLGDIRHDAPRHRFYSGATILAQLDEGTSYFQNTNVGIGTASPSTNLHLYSGSRVDTRIERNSTSAGEIGKLEFSAKDSASNVTSYALMLANSTVTTNGAEEGKLSVQVAGGSGYGITAAEFTKAGIVMGSGKGIDFGSNANSSGMTSELLDDYEEGTWTPALSSTATAPVLSYSVQTGSYTKVGNMVTCHARVRVNTITTPGTGGLTITGLPFATQDTVNLQNAGSIGHAFGFGTSSSGCPTHLTADKGSSTLNCKTLKNSAGVVSALNDTAAADLSSSAIDFSITYTTD
jgi:hypothetical protein